MGAALRYQDLADRPAAICTWLAFAAIDAVLHLGTIRARRAR